MTIPTRLLFLGTATSVGIPVIGCSCPTCTSDHPHDNRTRSSILLEGPWGSLLVDAGPDLRQQALRENISRVDAVLYTHEHLDHISGFDELRAFCWHRDAPLPLYGSPETLERLSNMHPWAFSPENNARGYVRPSSQPIETPTNFNTLQMTPFDVNHGSVRTFGYHFQHPLIGSIAYIPDVKTIPQESQIYLQDLDYLIIDALRPEGHDTHMSVEEALQTIKKYQPSHGILTHIAHEVDRPALEKSLPPQVSLAYDGRTLSFGES